jgi:hypothetical protein
MSITSQVTMAWNGVSLIIEAANPNTGAREKIQGVTLDNLPLEIQITLRHNFTLAQARHEAMVELNNYNKEEARLQREREINENNKREAAASDLRWQNYLAGLAPHVAAYHEFKKSQRLAKSKATARAIWGDVASTPGQGVELANKIIEPARRPKRVEMVKNGVRVTYYPQTESTKKVKKNGKKYSSPLSVDTSDFVF